MRTQATSLDPRRPDTYENDNHRYEQRRYYDDGYSSDEYSDDEYRYDNDSIIHAEHTPTRSTPDFNRHPGTQPSLGLPPQPPGLPPQPHEYAPIRESFTSSTSDIEGKKGGNAGSSPPKLLTYYPKEEEGQQNVAGNGSHPPTQTHSTSSDPEKGTHGLLKLPNGIVTTGGLLATMGGKKN